VVDLLVWRGHTSRSTTSICSEPSGAPAALTAIAGVLSCALVEFELADEPVRFPKKRTKPLAAALFHLYSLRPAPLRASNISPCHTRHPRVRLPVRAAQRRANGGGGTLPGGARSALLR